jgi:hypothetical protein
LLDPWPPFDSADLVEFTAHRWVDCLRKKKGRDRTQSEK